MPQQPTPTKKNYFHSVKIPNLLENCNGFISLPFMLLTIRLKLTSAGECGFLIIKKHEKGKLGENDRCLLVNKSK